MNKYIRQGEVMLIPVSKIPKGKTKESNNYIVGHSETGHHHVLESNKTYKVTQFGGDSVYLDLFDEARLTHNKTVNKHYTLTVSPGKYKVIHKSEYSPFTKIMERVWD